MIPKDDIILIIHRALFHFVQIIFLKMRLSYPKKKEEITNQIQR